MGSPIADSPRHGRGCGRCAISAASPPACGERGPSTRCPSNADFLLVGRFLGSNALGFYGMAWDLLRFVPDRLFRVAGRVTFPAFSRVQDDNAQLAHAFSEFTGYIARFVLPIMAMAAIAAPEFVGFVYGPKWMPTVLPIRLLSIGFTLLGLRIGIGSVFYSKDHPSYDMWTHGIRLILIVVTVAPALDVRSDSAASARTWRWSKAQSA